jgi:hypothetical protein
MADVHLRNPNVILERTLLLVEPVSYSRICSRFLCQHQWEADGSSKLVPVLRHLNVSVSAAAPCLHLSFSDAYYHIHKHTGRKTSSGIDLLPGSFITLEVPSCNFILFL